MQIPIEYHDTIRRLDVDEHSVTCDFDRWYKVMPLHTEEGSKLRQVEESLGEKFNRRKVLQFFQGDAHDHTKFLASMIWGYEAPEGSSASERGPRRVPKMMKSLGTGGKSDPLTGICVSDEEDIRKYYARHKSIKECGPNFFTKYLYFLGKSADERRPKRKYYPLIYDDRVATAFVKIAVDSARGPTNAQPHLLKLITAHARPARYAYLNYMRFARQQALAIDCDLDKIEYFMFRHEQWEDLQGQSDK